MPINIDINNPSGDINVSLREPAQPANVEINWDSRNYENLSNKPKIEGVTLSGNKTLEELGAARVTEAEIDTLFE